MSDFSTSVSRVARREHKCSCCRTAIEVGTKYIRHSGRYDGGFYSIAAHADCMHHEAHLNKMSGLHADDWRQLWEHFEECGACAFEDAPAAVRARFIPQPAL